MHSTASLKKLPSDALRCLWARSLGQGPAWNWFARHQSRRTTTRIRVAPNTYAVLHEDPAGRYKLQFNLHGHKIAEVDPHGDWCFFSAGFHTNLTAARLNLIVGGVAGFTYYAHFFRGKGGLRVAAYCDQVGHNISVPLGGTTNPTHITCRGTLKLDSLGAIHGTALRSLLGRLHSHWRRGAFVNKEVRGPAARRRLIDFLVKEASADGVGRIFYTSGDESRVYRRFATRLLTFGRSKPTGKSWKTVEPTKRGMDLSRLTPKRAIAHDLVVSEP